MTDFPDINHSYQYSSFDKDAGWCETLYTIEQSDNEIIITVIERVNESEIKRVVERGSVSKWYPDKQLVQIILENGERRYFHTQKKELDQSADFLFLRARFPGFDYRNDNHLVVLSNCLLQLASPFIKEKSIPDLKYHTVIWHEDKDGLRGELVNIIQFQVSFHSLDTGLDWFGMWSVVKGIQPEADVRSYIRRLGDENMDLLIHCPPEYHDEIRNTLSQLFH